MKRGYLYIAVTTLLFSSMEVALKLISGQFNPIQLNFSRFLVGGLVLIPFAVRELKKRGRKLDGKALGSFALLGLMGIAVSMSLYQLSVTRIQASVVGVLFSSNPVFVTLFAFLLLHETISKNQIAGLVLDVAGIVLIIQPWHLRLDALGVVYVLLATLLFALYGVCGKRQCARFGGIVVTCFGFLFGAAEMIAIAGLTHIPALSAGLTAAGLDTFASIPFFTGYTLTNLPIVLFIYVGVTGIGFTCYFLSMEVTSAQTTSLVFFFKPALAPLLAGHARVDERQLDIAQGVLPGQQLTRLKDEADFPVADAGQLVGLQIVHAAAVQDVLAAGGRVQAADDVHQRAFPRAAGAQHA